MQEKESVNFFYYLNPTEQKKIIRKIIFEIEKTERRVLITYETMHSLKLRIF